MIGSLNTMSYLEPHCLLKKPMAWLKRCQKVSIKEQYEKYNVRAFDLHLYFVGDKGRTIFKYKNIEYETFSVYEVLNYLDKMKDTYVRVVLEEKFTDDCELQEKRFINYCEIIETIYQNIKFFGGYRECDFKKIYTFKDKTPDNLIFYKMVNKLRKSSK